MITVVETMQARGWDFVIMGDEFGGTGARFVRKDGTSAGVLAPSLPSAVYLAAHRALRTPLRTPRAADSGETGEN